MAVYGILRNRGKSVPEEISVVGYDDHRLISETLYPALTTAQLPYSAMGARAAHLLLELLGEGGEAPQDPIKISGQIMHRASLVAPRKDIGAGTIINLNGRNET